MQGSSLRRNALLPHLVQPGLALVTQHIVGPPPLHFKELRRLDEVNQFPIAVIAGIKGRLVADPLRNRNIVWLGLLSKIGGVAMTYWAVNQGQVPADPFAIQPLFADIPWAIAFAVFLWKTRSSSPSQ